MHPTLIRGLAAEKVRDMQTLAASRPLRPSGAAGDGGAGRRARIRVRARLGRPLVQPAAW